MCTIQKRKTPPEYAIFGGEKKVLSKTKDEFILGIPLVRRISPIIIQPQTILIAFEFEDIRIAIAISNVRRAICFTVL